MLRKLIPEAIKKYVRSLAINVEEELKNESAEVHVVYTSSDDKHCINVGEPNFPLTPGTRQKRVLVDNENKSNKSGDHDTACKFTVQPSVKIDIEL